ncbi:MAG: 4Fe-4S binding protein, partial [Planctomycetota bacterium]|nr:4Fe-4S binding protein [Planctomycetota bacterium]
MSRQQERKLVALPVVSPTPASRMGRRRAVSLILVHVLILIHIGHWLGSGSTLSPLEPSEASFTLLNGAINAGAVFLVVLILSTLIFGRFFCGWACHVVA